MPNTYTQLYVQIVFSVKGRRKLIPQNEIKNDVARYITGIVQERGHKMLAINLMPDHAHIFIGLNPTQSISDLTRDVKASSCKLINAEKLTPFRFAWQRGFGAFSYNIREKQKIIDYVRNQEEHHRNKSFKEEYLKFLKDFEVEYQPDYLFEFYD